MRFANRAEAGRRLGELLLPYKALAPLVVALPGGARVGYEVARALDVPLELWAVRRIRAPAHPQLTLGAIAEGGMVHLDRAAVREAALGERELQRLVREEAGEVIAQAQRVRRGSPPARVEHTTVLLVDQGLVDGEEMLAVIDGLRAAKAARIVLAVPMAASATLERLRPLVDVVVCASEEPGLSTLTASYDELGETTDDALATLRALTLSGEPAPKPEGAMQRLAIDVEGALLEGLLTVPVGARGVVVLAHADASHQSPRATRGAAPFQEAGLATLVLDLLTPSEEAGVIAGASPAFDIQLLARRLTAAVDWLAAFELTRGLPCGCFSVGTAAAGALVTAVLRPSQVRAVVSCGGRPDLAWSVLSNVLTPTLLIVGSEDPQVLQLNRRAYHALPGAKQITVVPGATPQFQEPGALEQAVRLAIRWFDVWLAPREERARWE